MIFVTLLTVILLLLYAVGEPMFPLDRLAALYGACILMDILLLGMSTLEERDGRGE